MATHRATPGANLPESGTTTTRKSRSDLGPGLGASAPSSGLDSGLPGESGGLGSGLGTPLGAGSDAFGTTGASPAISDDSSTYGASGGRSFARAAGVMDQVKQQASTRVNEQKDRAAQGLGSVASAIRQASEHLRTENETLAAYADTAVDQIQYFADRMRDKQPAEMMQDLEQFARRNPAAFIGGAFLLGVGLARFLKSSDSLADTRDFDRATDEPYGRDAVGASRPLGGQVGYTGSDLARGDDLSRSSLTVDPSPGITS
ncbi:MAG TPA: hypothetical protein VMF13_20655 [Luteitalea sp.]|nr:hypothetical protein [Luteitalea sp.]